MFTNLIESNTDTSALKRRNSFFLATTAGYALILFTAVVVGILTYDAHVEPQTTNLLVEMWIPPVTPPVTPDRPQPPRRPASNTSPNSSRPTRPVLYDRIDNPIKLPEVVSVDPNPPAPPDAVVAPYVSDPPGNPSSSACETCSGNDTSAPPAVENRTPPPVVETPKPSTLRVSPGVIIAKVIELPKPAYPELAKRAGVQGPVNVQILIDETGKVLSAQPVKGSPLLIPAAVNAARRARFTPTMLGGQPVKIQGVITYNFVLQ